MTFQFLATPIEIKGNGKVEERTLTILFNGAQLESWRGEEQPEIQPFQIAREEVRTSVKEAKQIELDRERGSNDADIAPLSLIPGVSLDRAPGGPSLTDPEALPGVPDDVPVPLR